MLRTVNPPVAFALLGLLTAAVYAGIVYLYPLTVFGVATRPYDLEQLSRGRPWAAGFYVVGLLTVFAAFAAAAWLVRRMRRPLAPVVGFGVLFALILVWIYPVTAIDVFYYVLQGRQEVIYDLNPLVEPASQVPNDPLVPFVGEWSTFPSPYGPIWGVVSATVVRLGFVGPIDGALAFKAIALAVYGLCLLLLIWGTNGNAVAVLLFAWNPLVLLQGPGHAHNDLAMIAVAAAALVIWEKRRWWAAAIVVLALAASIKIPVLILGPLLLVSILRAEPTWRRRSGVFGAAVLLGAATLVIAFVPYWPPWVSLAGLPKVYASQHTYAIVSLVWLGLMNLHVGSPWVEGPRVLGLLVLLAGYGYLLRQVWLGRMALYAAGFWAFFLYLLTAASYRIWYPLWLVPLAALSIGEMGDGIARARMYWRTYLISLTSELSILMFYLVWRWLLNGTVLPKADWFAMHLLVIPWQFGVPLLAPLLIRRRPAERSETTQKGEG